MSSNLTKRKRRKTRKCLDEIRKRSRRMIFTNNSNEKVSENPNIANNMKENNSCRASRLTLAMFPKAIQSETITRPILAEMSKKKTINLDDIVGNKNCKTATKRFTNVSSSAHSANKTISDDEIENIEFPDKKFEDISNSSNSSGSYILFSPSNSLNSLTDTENIDPSPYHLQELCEEFLSDASSYMKENASEALLKDYNVEKVRQKLRELYIKYKVSQEKTENQRKSPIQIDEPIVQNPMDYIRQKYASGSKLHGHTNYYSHNLSDSSSSSQRSPQSPPPNLISPRSMQYETPEYIYFPHKLN